MQVLTVNIASSLEEVAELAVRRTQATQLSRRTHGLKSTLSLLARP
jgi:hypothetical protein